MVKFKFESVLNYYSIFIGSKQKFFINVFYNFFSSIWKCLKINQRNIIKITKKYSKKGLGKDIKVFLKKKKKMIKKKRKKFT